MTMRLLPALAVLAFATAAHAQTVTTGDFITSRSIALDTYVGGRVMQGAFSKGSGSAEVDGPAYIHQWPAIYFTAAFHGPEVDLRFNDTANIYTILIDGQPVQSFNRPGAAEVRVSGLSDANHVVRLEKNTESQDNTGEFDGFYVPAGEQDLGAPHHDRQIEFIGDSYSAGYGNTSSKRDCTEDEVWATTDSQQAWGPLAARHEDADYRVNAYSGFGIVRNYNGVAPKRSLVKFYPNVLFDPAVPADDDGWQPQVIVIALGGNDFSTPLNPGERWATQDDLRADYIATYVTFVQSLRAAHPDARFVLVTYGQDEIRADLDTIIGRLKQTGETRVDRLDVGTGFNLTGCDWHLNLDDDKRIAATVDAYLDQHPDYWTVSTQ